MSIWGIANLSFRFLLPYRKNLLHIILFNSFMKRKFAFNYVGSNGLTNIYSVFMWSILNDFEGGS